MSRCQRTRIALDCRLLHWPGVGRYCQELASALVKEADDFDFYWICNPGSGASLPQTVRTRTIEVRAKPFSASEQIVLPLKLRELGIDLFHAPVAHHVPLLGPPLVVTVHDLILRHFPEFMPSLAGRLYYRLMNTFGLWRARRVLAVSEFTRRDVIAQWPRYQDKISTVLNGVSTIFRRRDTHEASEPPLNLPEHYLLYVGTSKKHKNLPRLLAAYASLDPALRTRYPLVLVTPEDARYPEIAETIRVHNLEPYLCWRPGIPDASMPTLYAAARALVLVSLYEGFGLPVAEALACGTPCVVSCRSAMAEVGADAILCCESQDESSIAKALHVILTDDALHEELSERAVRQAARFSWRDAARQVAQVYRDAARGKTEKISLRPGSSSGLPR